jgi:hypothetical protein
MFTGARICSVALSRLSVGQTLVIAAWLENAVPNYILVTNYLGVGLEDKSTEDPRLISASSGSLITWRRMHWVARVSASELWYDNAVGSRAYWFRSRRWCKLVDRRRTLTCPIPYQGRFVIKWVRTIYIVGRKSENRLFAHATRSSYRGLQLNGTVPWSNQSKKARGMVQWN